MSQTKKIHFGSDGSYSLGQQSGSVPKLFTEETIAKFHDEHVQLSENCILLTSEKIPSLEPSWNGG